MEGAGGGGEAPTLRVPPWIAAAAECAGPAVSVRQCSPWFLVLTAACKGEDPTAGQKQALL